MSVAKPYTDRAVRAEIRRFIRLYPREQLDEAIVRYIEENFIPKLSLKKGQNLVCDPAVIITLVCFKFGISISEMKIRTRRHQTVYARQVMQFLLSTKTPLSLNEIGRLLNQHHTTVMASRNKIAEAYQKDPTVRKDIDELVNLLPKEAQTEQE